MNKHLLSLGSLAAAAVLFVALNVLAGAGLSRSRLDLTEGHLYTLSEGSRNIARKLDEPIRLTLYYSEKQSADVPAAYKSFGTRVKEVLREYALVSGGKITVEFANPEPFSDVEDRAVQAGLMGAPVGRSASERFYFGLVGVNSTDKQETIPFFRPDREEFLEYELTRLIYLLSDAKKKAIGVMSWLPIEGSQGNPMMGPQGQTKPWQIIQQAKEVFDVKTVERDTDTIPADVKVLLLVHPKSVPDKTLYAIDQFVLKGGRVLVFVDPLCEADVPPGINPMQAMQLPKNSSLPKLFDAWGVQMVEGKFAADRTNALRVSVGSQSRPEAVDYVAWLSLGADDIDHSDSVTGQLQSINVATAGILQKKAGATTEFTPLIQTSPDAMAMDVAQVSFVPDPKKLIAEFVPGTSRLAIAARITGKVKSAFPDGKPVAAPPPKPPDAPVADEPKEDPKAGWTAESAEPINVIVVADCDMLTDRFWVQEQRLGQMLLGYDKMADNGDLVIGALDNLSGSSDLISVRARGRFQRPFDKVKEIQKDAEKTYLTKEQQLQTKLRETEAKIAELQRQRPDAANSGAGGALLTPEQQAEIDKFRKQMVDTRKELREVQHQLRKDIESLDTKVRFLNIGLMPMLVGVAAVGLSFWRLSRRRDDRTTLKPRT